MRPEIRYYSGRTGWDADLHTVIFTWPMIVVEERDTRVWTYRVAPWGVMYDMGWRPKSKRYDKSYYRRRYIV
jgi:hypothetical protein